MTKPEIEAGIENKELSGQALVTGSNGGIGKQTALGLARIGFDVYVHGRDEEAGKEVVEEIEEIGQSARFFRSDFADQEDVREFAEEVVDACEEGSGLDLLVNNAGGYFRNAGKTDAGIEYTFAVNHLSHFILTEYFIPMLDDSDIGEIVNVSSVAHRSGEMDLSEVEGDDVTGGMTAYGRAKLANIHFTKSLDRRLDDNGYDINVNSIHPGGIPSSGFFRSLPGPLYKVAKVVGEIPVFDQPEDGAATILYAMLSDETSGDSGNYYKDTDVAEPTDLAKNEDKQEELWQKSEELTGTEWDDVF